MEEESSELSLKAVPMKENREQEEEKNMRATIYHGPRDMRIDQVPDPIIQAPTEVVARVTHACICGSDLWPYRGIDQRAPGDRMGHEWILMGFLLDTRRWILMKPSK